MLDVPPHLLQPLSVDTNISYDLDMSKFPGLDDPHQMYEPALLIATDWSQYVSNSDDSNVEFNTDDSEDDLFSLIESCHDLFSHEDAVNTTDTESFEAIFDDVITDQVTPSDVTVLEDTNGFLPDQSSVVNFVDFIEPIHHLHQKELSPFSPSVRGQKRRRSEDVEQSVTKKSKMADSTSPQLPSLVSVCPFSNQWAAFRGL